MNVFSLKAGFVRVASAGVLGVGALVQLTGCTNPGGSAALAPPVQSLAAHVQREPAIGNVRMNAAACGSAVVYAASYNNTVQIFNQGSLRKGPCGSIGGLNNPQGLFVDAGRNLWVVNGGTKQVFEFAPGGSTPSLTLADPAGFPVDVAVDNHSGTVYVTNFFNNGSAPGVVEVYASGSTSPTATLSDPGMADAFYDAVDNQGNLYVTYLPPGNFAKGHVFEWTGGTGTPADLGIVLQAPGGITTTKTGALLICDQAAPACGDFAPGSTTMTNVFAKHEPNPFAVGLARKEGSAFVEDPASGKLYAYKSPAGPAGRARSSVAVPGGAYAGVAVSPAAPEGPPW